MRGDGNPICFDGVCGGSGGRCLRADPGAGTSTTSVAATASCGDGSAISADCGAGLCTSSPGAASRQGPEGSGMSGGDVLAGDLPDDGFRYDKDQDRARGLCSEEEGCALIGRIGR